MTYCCVNFKTKKALREAVAQGAKIGIFEPGLGTAPSDGPAYLEGPHYPAPHTWYAKVEMKDGFIVKVS